MPTLRWRFLHRSHALFDGTPGIVYCWCGVKRGVKARVGGEASTITQPNETINIIRPLGLYTYVSSNVQSTYLVPGS